MIKSMRSIDGSPVGGGSVGQTVVVVTVVELTSGVVNEVEILVLIVLVVVDVVLSKI